LSSDHPVQPDLHPGGGDQTHHAGRTQPAAAPVWPEELRVHLPYPGRDPQRHRPALQQLQHPVPEDHRECKQKHTHTHTHTHTQTDTHTHTHVSYTHIYREDIV